MKFLRAADNLVAKNDRYHDNSYCVCRSVHLEHWHTIVAPFCLTHFGVFLFHIFVVDPCRKADRKCYSRREGRRVGVWLFCDVAGLVGIGSVCLPLTEDYETLIDKIYANIAKITAHSPKLHDRPEEIDRLEKLPWQSYKNVGTNYNDLQQPKSSE